jgi:hypothetical protein
VGERSRVFCGEGALRRPRVVSGLCPHHRVMNIFFRV